MTHPTDIETQIGKQLNRYETIGLAGLDEVSLLNRVDTKYVFHLSRLPDLLGRLHGDYRVLEVNGMRVCGYDSLYYDTANHSLYLDHHNKRGNRHKLRQRHYQSTDVSFLEVKFKTNKKRTVKHRFERSGIGGRLSAQDVETLSAGANLDASGLQPKLWVYFRRITFASRQLGERLTVDFGLHFKTMGGETAGCPDFAIVEVKQARSNLHSPVRRSLRQMRIPAVRISKYCLGSVLLFGNELKHNNFKGKLRTLEKIKRSNAVDKRNPGLSN